MNCCLGVFVACEGGRGAVVAGASLSRDGGYLASSVEWVELIFGISDSSSGPPSAVGLLPVGCASALQTMLPHRNSLF